MPKATLILHRKRRYDDGAILELKLWQVPAAVPGSAHLFKYSLFYGTGGQRLIGIYAMRHEVAEGRRVPRCGRTGNARRGRA